MDAETQKTLSDEINTKSEKGNTSWVVVNSPAMAAYFLGPKAEHASMWEETFQSIFQDYVHWRRNYFPEDPMLISRSKRREEHEVWFDTFNSELHKVLNQLKGHYPFYSPRYLAHMLSEQTFPSVAGYFAGMLYNPNNVTDEAAPITVQLEIEVGKMIAEMLGYNKEKSWAHLTSWGTLANIEALWVMRLSQFTPLIIQEFCKKEKIAFPIKMPNNIFKQQKEQKMITDCTQKELLSLIPNESIFMPRKLAKFLIKELKQEKEEVLNKINTHFTQSKYNIAKRGIISVYQEIKFQQIIFVSASAHYSIKKAANVLWIGENNVRLIPVDSCFRMDIVKLKEMLWNLKEHEVASAVVWIVGTTEEWAIDPIGQICELRELYENEKKSSFWFHIDAAWGGYIRTLLNAKELDPKKKVEDFHKDFLELTQLTGTVQIPYSQKEEEEWQWKLVKIEWGEDWWLFRSIFFMNYADSITIDPHKLGYIPYPAWVITYKNGLVTELISQKAKYISDDSWMMKNIDEPLDISAVWPYILEGSKPWAAAVSCWLAHKTIPLNFHAHGKIIKRTLLNARKLYTLISQHKKTYIKLEKTLYNNYQEDFSAFTFNPIYFPDTNVVCFIALPQTMSNGKLIKKDTSLKNLNILNREIYEKLSIKNNGKNHKMPYLQDFFVSRTTFESSQYSFDSIKEILWKYGIDKKAYEQEGLFVMRSTVMNPRYYDAERQQMNYLKDFVTYLHKCTREVLNELQKKTL